MKNTSSRFVDESRKAGRIVISLLFLVLPIEGAAQIPQSSEPLRVTATSPATGSPASKASPTDNRYRIGPGDIIEVLVYNQPQLSRPVLRVDGRGMIRMPLLEGEIKAACKTESDLAKELTTRYQEYQKHPQVDVYVKEFNSQLVSVVGAVNTPGRFQLQRRVRLFEILTLAGGPSAAAGRTIQIVHNPEAALVCDETANAPDDEIKSGLSFYSLTAALRAEDAANPYLRPGDVITVPEAEQIFVVGNVNRPAPIPLKDTLTISKAIIMAGGVLPNSDQKNIRVIRQPTNANKTEMLVNLKEVNRGAAEDIQLQANDVIEVPAEGGAKSVFRGILRTLVPTVAHLPTRIIY